MANLSTFSTNVLAPATLLFGGGGNSSAKKAAEHNADNARQLQEFTDIINQNLAQLVPGSEEYNKLIDFGNKYAAMIEQGAGPVPELGGANLDQQPAAAQYGSQLVQQQQQRIASGGAATPLEARTDTAFKGLQDSAKETPFEQDLLNSLNGQPTSTPSGQIFSNTISKAANPTVDDSVFQHDLNLVENRVNQSAAGRGLLGSGLRLDMLGTAGEQAALDEANRQTTLQQQNYQNATGLYDAGQTLRNRDIGLQGDLVNLQLGRESNLTSLLNKNSQTALQNQNSLQSDRASQALAESVDAQDAAAAQKQQLAQLAGTGVGYAVGGPMGAAIGGSAGSMLAGGKGSLNIDQLLSSQQAQNNKAGTVQPLSIQSNQSPLDIQKLLQALQNNPSYGA